jgi:hypothetical protein
MSDSMAKNIEFSLRPDGESAQRSVEVDSLVIAGWAGRDREALEKHITELEHEGIPRPARTPEFYRVGVNLLTTAPAIQVPGDASSGEIEAFILKTADELWVGIGSDHTDRKLEATSVVMSKQACPKPIGKTLWRYSDIKDHWDAIQMRSFRYSSGERIVYQHGSLSANLSGNELLDRYEHDHGAMANGMLMFCGTIPAEGGIRFSNRFEMEMHDPVRDLYIRHAYDIFALPVN